MPMGVIVQDEGDAHAYPADDKSRATVPCGIPLAPRTEHEGADGRSSALELGRGRDLPTMRPMLDTPVEPALPEAADAGLGTLTVVRGFEVGRSYALDADGVVVGRAPLCEVWIDDACVSREHARIARRGARGYVIEDLRSTNGTFVDQQRLAPGRPVPLLDGARVQIGPTALLRFALLDARDELVQRDLFYAATRDVLTGAYNRRYFEERLAIEIARARRAHLPLSLLLLDVDGLKRVNDAHGHLAGDQLLRAVAGRLAHHVRMADVLARWGGDEFALLAPAADAREAGKLAERLCAEVALLTVDVPGAALRVTISVGGASLDEIDPAALGVDLLARADARLYGAKRAGKNQGITG